VRNLKCLCESENFDKKSEDLKEYEFVFSREIEKLKQK
jgi:hypothetical protein